MEYISPRTKLQYLITEFANTYELTVDQSIKAMREELQTKKGKTYTELKGAGKGLITLVVERS
tara:strand:+ start:100 stop:288 length:189 start_codon:yes stop_codon:yes gene_type:complete